MPRKIFLVLLAFLAFSMGVKGQNPDSEELGKALEYFTSAKYHEALLIFQKLDKRYKLNDRFKAYIGLCYYHEWDYKNATKYLDAAIVKLDGLAPHERSVYYFHAAESHFNLKEYHDAIPYYERTLTVCYDNERADCLYRLGFCYMFLKDWYKACDNFKFAEDNYRQYNHQGDIKARLAQISNMIRGCQAEIDKIEFAEREKKREDSLRIAYQQHLDSVASLRPDSSAISVSAGLSVAADGNTTVKASVPTDDNPQQKNRQQHDVSPIDLQGLYEDKITVEE
jgi:tetratricopeptide (TPR) repeat protein